MNRIFSGVQPTGNLHLGNYLGAIRNWVRLQQDYECIYCIVDLHAITVEQDAEELRSSIREVTACLLAAGIDPETSIVFNQSQVSVHTELAWIFACTARLGWLNRMTQFKEKAGAHREQASVGLYAYPTLMAADILAYKATHVPVGEDQKQHLELTRDIAQSFNAQYGIDYFPLVEPIIQDQAARVMSLRDGTKKMSKSDASDYSRINLSDSPEVIARKIRRARTDPDLIPGTVAGLEGRAEAANLVGLYAALDDITIEAACRRYEGAQFSKFKEDLAELTIATLGPISAGMARLMEDPAGIERVLKRGAERARALAQPILSEVHDIVGLLRA